MQYGTGIDNKTINTQIESSEISPHPDGWGGPVNQKGKELTSRNSAGTTDYPYKQGKLGFFPPTILHMYESPGYKILKEDLQYYNLPLQKYFIRQKSTHPSKNEKR